MRIWKLLVAALLAIGMLGLGMVSSAVPVSITVPVGSSIAVGDLDGLPGTGDWSDAGSWTIPLENGAAAPYGSAMMYAKHDETYMYVRIDGSIDVAWLSAVGSHFWLGFQVSPADTSHHGSGSWDGVFLGLWDGTDYTPMPTYPPPAIDTNGFSRPPAKDATQDTPGFLRYSGSTAPFEFTAEWRRPLSSGDAGDLSYVADDTTTYNFFVTTDSNGGGSAGGGINHRQMTNLNTMKFAGTPPQAGEGIGNLVKRSAWPEHHHFSVSKDEDGIQSLFARVANVGGGDVHVIVRFAISGAQSLELETSPVLLTPGEERVVSTGWGPLQNPGDLGKYSVVAQAWFDSDGDGIFESPGEKMKSFSFSVVP